MEGWIRQTGTGLADPTSLNRRLSGDARGGPKYNYLITANYNFRTINLPSKITSLLKDFYRPYENFAPFLTHLSFCGALHLLIK